MNFFSENSHHLNSSVSRASVHGLLNSKFESRLRQSFFFIISITYFSTWKYISYAYVKMAVLYENVRKQIFFETLKVLLCIEKILFFDEIKLDKKNESDYN